MYDIIQEKKIIRLSMLILSLTLIIVYMLLYYVKGKKLTTDLKNNTEIENMTGKSLLVLQKSGTQSKVVKPNIQIKPINNKNNTNTGKTNINNNTVQRDINENNTIKTGKSESEFGFNNIEYNNTKTSTGLIKTLSGTKLYYKTLDSIEKLGIRYKYILTDSKDIYYVYLGVGKLYYNFEDIVRSMSGSLFVISTEQEIIKNKLFGDKVTYINIPEYKNKLVLMLIQIGDNNRLIQVDYKTYYKSKVYLQQIFDNI